MNKLNLGVFISIIFLSIIARIIPHLPNFAPIGGLAIFSGIYLKDKRAILVPILSMVFSDIFLGFHATIPYVYGSFILIYLLSKKYVKSTKFGYLTAISISSSILFFLITNFGVWFTGTMYVKNIFGLIQSYLMGLPFFRNTLLSDLVYSFSFVYGYKYLPEFIKYKLSKNSSR